MPQVKVHNCESLKKTCVKYVANNINYWYNKKSTNENDILHSDTPEFISPFELLRKFSPFPSQIFSKSIFKQDFK